MREIYSSLTTELKRRAARAYVSNYTVRSTTLRRQILNSLDERLGSGDTLLAPPVFEATFGWAAAQRSISEMTSPAIHPRLVDAMHTPPPGLEGQRFDRSWPPYRHQEEAWHHLLHDEVRSVVVSSGTGSGKTECFMVPILSSLAEEAEQKKRPLVGVRALMLYPLNALINSQRQRLRAWSSGLDDRVRFCLFNGNTPNEVRGAQQRAAGPEVLDRKTLRAEPPPILVTNATMLEYMLVRHEDQPILRASQGQLKWVILDEAHTYLGSHAAEMALLIRRVLMAFGVSAADVRFVATSATIGKRGDSDVQNRLRSYLAKVGGIDEASVHLVEGVPEVPTLEGPAGTNDTLPDNWDDNPSKIYEACCRSIPARAVRSRLCERPASVAELSKIASATGEVSQEDLIRFVDLATQSSNGKSPFLRARGHFFERVPGGLWACTNPSCPDAESEDSDWGWGKLFHTRRQKCDAFGCEAKVLELAFCRGCGEALLAAQEREDSGRTVLTPRSLEPGDLEEELDLELSPEEEEGEVETKEGPGAEASAGRPRLISRAPYQQSDAIVVTNLNPTTAQLDSGDVRVRLVLPEPGSTRFRCPCCGAVESGPGGGFIPFKIGQSFALGVALPALLEEAPADPRSTNERMPSKGRRLITFTDSRQGTALLALRAQLNAQRNTARTFIYHALWERARPPNPSQVADLEAQLKGLAGFKDDPIVATVIIEKERELRELKAGSKPRATSKELSDAWMRDQGSTGNDPAMVADDLKHLTNYMIGGTDVPRFLLLREFLRRPMRANSMETMGLAFLKYPTLETEVTDVPFEASRLGLNIEEWRQVLKLVLDFFVRANGCVTFPSEWRRWFGGRAVTNWLLSPGEEGGSRRSRQVRWPNPAGEGRVARLLRHSITTDAKAIGNLLNEVWDTFHHLNLFESRGEGFQFKLWDHSAFEVPKTAFLCPVTRRLLDNPFRAYTPYIPRNASGNLKGFECKQLQMPTLRYVFGRDLHSRGEQVDRRAILDWLENNEDVARLRKEGVWGEFSDRIAAKSEYLRIEEHSAQVTHRDLQRIESKFGEGKLNVLSCSTTMEMGIDIGGLSVVGMNNAPPGPSNFLQRAGRAGRRGESAAVSFTLCQDNPHGRAVFRNPLWPFETPIHVPDVQLSSERIVQRHVNATLLSLYFASAVNDPVRLKTGPFFDPEQGSPHDEKFSSWLVGEAERGAAGELAETIAVLTRYSSLEGAPIGQVLSEAARAMTEAGDSWRDRLRATAAQVDIGDGSIAQKAAAHHTKRLRGEYLLKYLTAERFLPGHGFPTLVVPFVNTTMEDMKKKRNSRDENEGDSGVGYGDYASRTLSTAIREYAPGNAVVLGGRVFTSKGLTLHWQMPPDQSEIGESQQIKWAWRCRNCGATGTRLDMHKRCEACGEQNIRHGRFIQPSGMAVDIRDQPTNDLSARKYLPYEPAWSSTAGAAWTSLPVDALGRFRHTDQGSIFHRSRGEHGTGFAVCLRCGRADSERPAIHVGDAQRADPQLPPTLRSHRALRGGKEKRSSDRPELCAGNESEWAVMRNLWLGVEETTDILEIQLAEPSDGRFVNDPAVASSIAVAMRSALAEVLGLEEREMGFGVLPARGPSGEQVQSMLLFDNAAGGAGFVGAAPSELPEVFRRARNILLCHENCDAACHACLLNYDTSRLDDKLNRHAALSVLTEEFIAALDLPSEDQLFGDSTEFEFQPLASAMNRELARRDLSGVELWLAGPSSSWDLSSEWEQRRTLLRLAGAGHRVTLMVDHSVIDGTPEVRDTLVRLANACAANASASGGSFELRVTEGEPQFLVRLRGQERAVAWAAKEQRAYVPGPTWGKETQLVRCEWRLPEEAPSIDSKSLDSASLVSRAEQSGYVVCEVDNSVDGSLADFGARFWQAVAASDSELGQQLAQGPRLASVVLVDRYLRSPLNLRLAYEVLRALESKAGGISPETEIEVITASGRYGSEGRRYHDNWGQPRIAEAVGERVISSLSGHTTFSARQSTDVSHFREIRLRWNDGSSCSVRPDQGVTFMATKLRESFNFSWSDAKQAEELLKKRCGVEKKDAAPIVVYVGAVVAGGGR